MLGDASPVVDFMGGEISSRQSHELASIVHFCLCISEELTCHEGANQDLAQHSLGSEVFEMDGELQVCARRRRDDFSVEYG